MKQITHLISNTSFGKSLPDGLEAAYYRRVRNNYDNLLDRPLEIGMLVPVHPNTNQIFDKPNVDDYEDYQYGSHVYGEWLKAQEKALFEAFEVKGNSLFHNGTDIYIDVSDLPDLTIEQFMSVFKPNMFKLTPAALKEIYNT